MPRSARGRPAQAPNAPTGRDLYDATNAGQVMRVHQLLSKNIHPDSYRDAEGRTALHRAAAKLFVEILKPLLVAGANANVVDKNGDTPLHYASFHGYDTAVEELVFGGADVTIRNKAGKTAVEDATKNGFLAKVQSAIDRGLAKRSGTTAGAAVASSGPKVACAYSRRGQRVCSQAAAVGQYCLLHACPRCQTNFKSSKEACCSSCSDSGGDKAAAKAPKGAQAPVRVHPLFYDRPPSGRDTIVVSYQSTQEDTMWRVCDALRKQKFAVFNGKQVKPGEVWDEVYFDEYLDKCTCGIAMLSTEFFASDACRDELKMMYTDKKSVVPIKVGSFARQSPGVRRMLGNHIPAVDGDNAQVFTDEFEFLETLKEYKQEEELRARP